MKKKNKLGQFISLWGDRKSWGNRKSVFRMEMSGLNPYIAAPTRQKYGLFTNFWMRIKAPTRWQVVAQLFRHLKERI